VSAAVAVEPGAERGRRREQAGWYVYDWAASVFNTTVVSVFLGPYLTTVAQAAAGDGGRIDVLGLSLRPEALYPYATSLSVFLQLLLLPVIGALADRSGRKRELLGGLAYAGALATAGLYFVDGDRYLLGAGLFVAANVAFGASPQIATSDERDRVSANGWAVGYLGGGLLLLLNLFLFLRHDAFGLTESHAVRVSLLSAGGWWALFTLVPLAALRNRRVAAHERGAAALVAGSFGQLARTLAGLRRHPRTLLFLAAYIAFNDGVQTVIGFAATFADQALGLGTEVQIGTILMVQFVAFGGALALGRLARRYGTKRTVLASLVVWAAVVAAAPLLQEGSSTQFFALGFGIAIVLGGTQALSRSLFSLMIPAGKEAEYFGLYEISDRGSAFLGAFVLGVALDATGSYRLAILSVIVFFALGFVLLALVDVPRAIREAGNAVPDRV
jgi:UMF1 family MFS transporter